MKMPLSLLQGRYVPLIPDGRSYLTATHSWKTVLISKSSEPEHTCGTAQRVGYTGNQEDALAIYRLRVHFRNRKLMLPGFFVFQEGIFVGYGDEQKQDEDLREYAL
jgi:hypothetical protein